MCKVGPHLGRPSSHGKRVNLEDVGPNRVSGPDVVKEGEKVNSTFTTDYHEGGVTSRDPTLSGIDFRDSSVVPMLAPPKGFIW